MSSSIFKKIKQKGQALVETALFLPVFMVIIAGVVEVSQLTISKNRIADSARAASRFGANGGEDEGMVTVVFNAITQTMEVTNDRWDIWVIRGQVNSAGDDFVSWELNHAYGFSNTVDAVKLNQGSLKQQILDELHIDHNGNVLGNDQVRDLDLIGTYVIHDVNSLLGLDGFPMLEGVHSVSSLNVMRVGSSVEQSNGCTGFPIAIHEGVRSVTPPGEGSSPFPDFADFTYPDSNHPTYESYFSHVDNIPLSSAAEGYVFRLQNGFGSGNFGWLQWNQGRPPSANILEESLTWPGNSADYLDHGDNQTFPAAAAYPHIVRGYVEPGDSTDTSIHVGDWVAANTGSINSNGVRTALEEMVDFDRTLRLIVWDTSEAQGNNGLYRISGFAIFRLIGYSLQQGNGGSWILGEFIRWDESCGQLNN